MTDKTTAPDSPKPSGTTVTHAEAREITPLKWASNGEAGDGQNICSLCEAETDEPHHWTECQQVLALAIDHGWHIAGTLQDELTEAEGRTETAERLYNELLMQVGNVYPGETRHETAKRYLYAAENQNNPPAQAKDPDEP